MEEDPQPPAPPRSIPPMPPSPELLRAAAAPHVPLTPMMDFLQRRLDSLERDLSLERERAQAAQNLLKQQEALRGEVESQLKALTANLRREKAERESEEVKSHARGRIDALEKRLDEMHQSWVSLLKDAIAQRDSGAKDLSASQAALAQAVTASQTALAQMVTSSQTALAQSVAAAQGESAKEQAGLAQEQALLKARVGELSGALKEFLDKIGLWRSETQGLAQLGPELRGLASQIPAESRRFEGQVAQTLAQFSTELRESLASWQRQQAIEIEKQESRLQALAREREALLRAAEEQNHALRQEHLKEKIHRDKELAENTAELERKLDTLAQGQERGSRESAEVRANLAKAIEKLMTPPQAKDAAIAALELEKGDLLRVLKSRTESLQRYTLERREVEKTLGESLLALQREFDEERRKHLAGASRLSQLEFDNACLQDKLAAAQRSGGEKDARWAALAAERDELVGALLAEAEKVRQQIEDRGKAESEWARKLEELRQGFARETQERAKESAAVSELRAQIATLSDHLARALRENDSVEGRTSSWENERQSLLSALKEKEEMISMLNATFQNMLRQQP